MFEIERLPIRKGLTYPATLPTELTHAIPAAAAVEERIAVGRRQKIETAPRTPAAATASAANETQPGTQGIADAANAAEPATPATCQRRSLVPSEWRAMVSMAIKP